MAELFESGLRRHGEGEQPHYSLEVRLPRKMDPEHIEQLKGVVAAAVSKARESLKPQRVLELAEPTARHVASVQTVSREPHVLLHDLGSLPPATAEKLRTAVETHLRADSGFTALHEEYEGRKRLAATILQVEDALSRQGVKMSRPTISYLGNYPHVSLGHAPWLKPKEITRLGEIMEEAIRQSLHPHGQAELSLGDRKLEMEKVETTLDTGERLQAGLRVRLPLKPSSEEMGEKALEGFLNRVERYLARNKEYTDLQRAYYARRRQVLE